MLGENHPPGESAELRPELSLEGWVEINKMLWWLSVETRKGKETYYLQRTCSYMDMGELAMLRHVLQCRWS